MVYIARHDGVRGGYPPLVRLSVTVIAEQHGCREQSGSRRRQWRYDFFSYFYLTRRAGTGYTPASPGRVRPVDHRSALEAPPRPGGRPAR